MPVMDAGRRGRPQRRTRLLWGLLLLAASALAVPLMAGTTLDCPPCPGDTSDQGWERPTNQQSTYSADAAAPPPPPPLLERIFIVVSFAWNIHKVVHLEHALTFFMAYPTNVAITIVSDSPPNVRTLLHGLGIRGVAVWDGFDASRYDHHKYGLLYEHRHTMLQASLADQYTTYMYVEDDTRVPWPALVSWALDTEYLEPLGYLRNLYRTEFSAEDGALMLTDIWHRCNMTAWEAKLQVALLPSVRRCTRAFRFEAAEACVHEYYYQPTQAYMGMWVATHATLLRFIARSDFLEVNPSPGFEGVLGYGYPERSTGDIQLVNSMKFDLPAVVLPYYPGNPLGPKLAAVAAIGHSRNGYANNPDTPLGKLPVRGALFYDPPPKGSLAALG